MSTGGKRFELPFLFQMFLVACDLRSDKQLRAVVHRVLCSVFLDGDVASLSNGLDNGLFPLPSPVVVSQMKYVVDCAYMEWRRELSSRYFVHDSLPAIFSSKTRAHKAITTG